jgi:hypothetical protein
VGPAVLSPILIQGLVGALVESTLPQSFFCEMSLRQVRPLIVGVEVEASIEVVSVVPVVPSPSAGAGTGESSGGGDLGVTDFIRARGYELELETSVKRVSDGGIIATGRHIVWMPDLQ